MHRVGSPAHKLYYARLILTPQTAHSNISAAARDRVQCSVKLQVRNCRLAMLAFLGFSMQAFVTGKGPLENAVDHLRDPFGANSEPGSLSMPCSTLISLLQTLVLSAVGQNLQRKWCHRCLRQSIQSGGAWRTVRYQKL